MHHVLHAWEGLALFGSVSVVGNMATDRLFKELKPRCHRKRSVELSLMKSLNVSYSYLLRYVSAFYIVKSIVILGGHCMSYG